MKFMSHQFPRDFKPKILGKRIDYSMDVVQINPVFKIEETKKRSMKLESKLSDVVEESSETIISLDGDESEDPLEFAKRVQSGLHLSQETTGESYHEFSSQNFE